MLILKDDMLKSHADKANYLMKHAKNYSDLFTHSWHILKSNESELCFKCSVCGYIYGLIVFNTGIKSRVFLPSENSLQSVDIISCKQAVMSKALI